MHEYWISGTHNVAVIQLNEDEPFVLNNHVMPVCLPYRELDVKPKSVSIIAGFGHKKDEQSGKLQLIAVDVQKSEKCQKLAKTDPDKKIFASEWDRLHYQVIISIEKWKRLFNLKISTLG